MSPGVVSRLMARPFVNRMGLRPVREGMNIDDIATEVARKYGLTIAQLRGRRHSRHIAWPRHELMYRASRETSACLSDISRYLGGRDHTTVRHGIAAHKARLAQQRVVV